MCRRTEEKGTSSNNRQQVTLKCDRLKYEMASFVSYLKLIPEKNCRRPPLLNLKLNMWRLLKS